MIKKVGCDLCMLKITITHDFVAKNFEIKKFFSNFCNEIAYGFGERTCTASTRGIMSHSWVEGHGLRKGGVGLGGGEGEGRRHLELSSFVS